MKRLLATLVAGTALAVPALPAVAATTDTVLIVIDASASMAGANIAAVTQSAQTSVVAVPSGVRVGLYAFTSKGNVTVEPTNSRRTITKAIAGIKPSGATALYDGIIRAIAFAPNPASTRVLLVTDATDVRSASGRQAVIDAINTTGIALDVVTVGAKDTGLKAMRALTITGNGSIYQARNSAALGAVFGRALLAAAPTPAASPTPSPTTPSASPSPVPTQTSPADTGNGSVMWALRELVLGPGGLAVMSAMVAYFYGYILVVRLLQRRRERSMDRAIANYDVSTPGARKSADEQSAFIEVPGRKRRAARKSNRVRVAEIRSKAFPILAERLERADLSYTPERWITLCIGTFLGLFLVLTVLTGVWPLALFASAGLVAYGQNAYLTLKAAQFKRAFESGLADFLVLIASGLRSGMSFVQSVDSASAEGSGPVERQFRRALGEVRVGSTLEIAMGRVAERMESDDLRWTIAALAIQREVGGNLSKILDTAAATIRARADLRREVRTLSAEGRLSAYVLLALPLGIFGFLLLTRRAYLQVFWTEPIGMVMLGMFFVIVSIGWYWIRKVVAVEV